MISIIIPTIGRTDTFVESLESAIKCSPAIVTEIIIADNSQDATFHVRLEQMIKADARCVVLEYPSRLNISDSWNFATRKTTENWILYLHDDDVLFPGALEEVAKKIHDEIAFIYCDFVTSYGKYKRHSHYKNKSAFEDIIDETPRFISTLINKNKLLENNGWDPSTGYFSDLVTFLLLAKDDQVMYGNVTLGLYRVHANASGALRYKNTEYGNYLGYAIEKLLMEYTDAEKRRKICFKCIDTAWPYRGSIFLRAVRKVLKWIGYRALFYPSLGKH